MSSPNTVARLHARIVLGIALVGTMFGGSSTLAGEPQGAIAWGVELGVTQPSTLPPAIAADGTIYASDNETLYAISPDGKIRWAIANAYGNHPVSLGSDGTLYTGRDFGGTSTIVAIAPDGTILWTRDFQNTQGMSAGPGVGPDGNIYAVLDTVPNGSGAVAVDPSGNVLWNNPGSPGLHQNGGGERMLAFGFDRFWVALAGRSAPPALWSFNFNGSQVAFRGTGCESIPQVDPLGQVIVTGQLTCGVTALDHQGNTLWNAPLPERLGNDFLVLPAIGPDGAIYTSQRYSRFWALEPDGTTRWYLDEDLGLQRNFGVTPSGRSLLEAGILTVGQPGHVRAFDTLDGSLVWHVDLPRLNGIPLRANGSPAFSPDGSTAYFHVIGSDNAGRLYAITLEERLAPVTIQLDPESATVRPGERLFYDVTVSNPAPELQTVNAWIDIFKPNGQPYNGNPIEGPKTVTLATGQTRSVTVSLRIPASAPPSGPYTLSASLGSFPLQVDASSSFTFTIVP